MTDVPKSAVAAGSADGTAVVVGRLSMPDRPLPGWLGLPQTGLDVSTWDVARSVLIFLGVPPVAGYLTRRLGEKAKGRHWPEWSAR